MKDLSRGMAALLNTAPLATDFAAIRKIAADYRTNNPDEHGKRQTTGVVVVFKNEPQGWVNELRNPESWSPGCVAVEADGTCHIATGGDAYNGAADWTRLSETAEKAEAIATQSDQLAANIQHLTPPRIGQPWPQQGGIYAGQMLYPNGEQRYIIMHPNTIGAEWGGYGEEIEGANDYYNGAANTQAMIDSGLDLPIISELKNLNAAGEFTDYHIPAIREQNLLTINLPHLLEKEWHWTSTQYSAYTAWGQYCGGGSQLIRSKGSKLAARAVRSILVIE